MTTITGEYVPSTSDWVRGQVDTIAETGTTSSVQVQERPVVLLTMRGKEEGTVRKVPLMRVEHEGVYAAVASKGGAPDHPQWYFNLRRDPDLDLQDDTGTTAVRARVIESVEREQWWERCVAAFPPYAEYQVNTDRQIPVFLLEPR